MKHRFVRALSTICLCAVTGAVAAAVAPPGEVRLEAGRTLRSGESIVAAWTALPPDTEEFELLLRVESEVPFTLRLTECKEPALTSLTWRVPDLPCSRARILLRHGRRGREVLWGVSAPFRILTGPAALQHHVVMRRGELWVKEGKAPASHTLTAGDLHLFSAPGGTPFEADSPAAGPGRVSPPRTRPLEHSGPPPALEVRPRTSRVPRDLPLRI